MNIHQYESKSDTKVEKKVETVKDIKQKIEKYKNNPQIIDYNQSIGNIFNSVCRLLSLRGSNSSKYAYYDIPDGKIMCFRFSDHDTYGENFSAKHLNVGFAILYKYCANRGFTNKPYQEYEIAPDVFAKNTKDVVDSIINALYKALNDGVFTLNNPLVQQIDTTRKDTYDDIIKRFTKYGTYTFTSKDIPHFNFQLSNITNATKQKIEVKVNVVENGRVTNKQEIIKIQSKGNVVTYNGVTIKPTRQVKDVWKQFVQCCFRLASEHKSDKYK